jgi:hypothetical protein
MAESAVIPNKVHLVGSVGLDSVPEVFRTVGKLLGRRLRRVPDGEPGGRRQWIGWQYPLFLSSPFLEPAPGQAGLPVALPSNFCLAPGVNAADIRFGELGYSREARASYLDFVASRRRAELPSNARFQVSLPTPYAIIGAFCPGKDMMAIEGAFEKSMLREVESICREIPHKDLCIQWDVCSEMVMWDGRWQGGRSPFTDVEGEVLSRMKRLCAAVPKDVELGIHLCYGDLRAKHFIEPLDAGKLVEVANALTETVKHAIAYIHMPVPLSRTDDAYFKPLGDLRLKPGTEVYLGLVHADDGAEGTNRRIAAASQYASDFGNCYRMRDGSSPHTRDGDEVTEDACADFRGTCSSSPAFVGDSIGSPAILQSDSFYLRAISARCRRTAW